MERVDMIVTIMNYCHDVNTCDVCNIKAICKRKGNSPSWDGESNEVLSEACSLIKSEYMPEAKEPAEDAVNHPNHYNRDGAMECIEEMVLLFGIEETKSFCKLNAWKYRYRAADKGGEEDMKKSDRYVQIYKELCDRLTHSEEQQG